MYRQGVKISIDGNRPVTAGSAMDIETLRLDETEHMGPTAQEEKPVPVSLPSDRSRSRPAGNGHNTGNPRPVSGFVKKLGGKLGWGKKPKIQVVPPI